MRCIASILPARNSSALRFRVPTRTSARSSGALAKSGCRRAALNTSRSSAPPEDGGSDVERIRLAQSYERQDGDDDDDQTDDVYDVVHEISPFVGVRGQHSHYTSRYCSLPGANSRYASAQMNAVAFGGK